MPKDRSLGKTIWNLGLALFNATLILIALCLWFGWQIMKEANALTTSVANSIVSAEPLRDDMTELTDELARLRQDVQSMRFQTEAAQSATLAAIGARVDQANERMTTLSDRINTIVREPEQLIDHAIDRSADAVTQSIADMRGCVPANS